MGCDIHMHAEIKVAGKWLHYDQPDCQRDYDLFEKMAGVRGDEAKAIASPRGLPDDASDTTKFDSDHWDTDGHAHSWLSAQEILDLADWDEARGRDTFKREWDRWLCGNNYSDFIRYPDSRPKGIEDVRFVFWFDN